MRDRIRALPKKERAKAERKMLEKLAEKAAKKAAKKRAEAEAVAATQRAHAVDHRTLDDTPSDESEIDSDDEEAILARRNRQKAKEAGGGAYTLTPEQRKAAEKAEADRVAAIRAAKEAEEAEARRKLEEKEAEEKFAAMRLREKESGQPITWVFEKGSIVRGHGGIRGSPGRNPASSRCRWRSRRCSSDGSSGKAAPRSGRWRPGPGRRCPWLRARAGPAWRRWWLSGTSAPGRASG